MSLRKISVAFASVVVLAAGAPAFAQNAVNNVSTINVISGNRNTTKTVDNKAASTAQRGISLDRLQNTVPGNSCHSRVSESSQRGRR